MRRASKVGCVLALLCAATSFGVPASPARADETARAVALAQALRTKRLKSIDFKDAKIEELLRFLRISTGFNFAVRRAPIQKAGVDLDAVTFTVTLSEVTVATVLNLLLPPHGLEALVVDNVVYVTTHADALGKPVFRLYGITHLTWQKTDFHAPEINLYPSGYTPPEYTPEVPVENDPLTEPANIVDLVKQMVDESFDQEGWSISATKTYMSVKAPQPVQAQVAAALEGLASFK